MPVRAEAAPRHRQLPELTASDHSRSPLHISTITVRVDCFDDLGGFRDFFKTRYGPTVAAYRTIGGDLALVGALDRDLADLARRHDRGSGTTIMDWEYLLLTARKRS